MAQSALLGIVLLAIATLPVSANDIICLPGDQVVAEYPVSPSADQTHDCLTQAQQMDHGDYSAHTAQKPGQTPCQPGDAAEKAMRCMPAIGTALALHQIATPVLAGILLQTDRWSMDAVMLPSRALSAQDRPPQAL